MRDVSTVAINGRYPHHVAAAEGALVVDGRQIPALAEPAARRRSQQAFPARPGSSRQPGADVIGAPQATARAVPELAGRFDGIAVRAPVPVGSIVDIVFAAGRPTTTAEVNEAFRQEAASARYDGTLGVSDDALVSADIIGDARAAVVDLDLTRVVGGTLVKVMAWYDNECGFTHQMIREARDILGVSDAS
jgi:hypothetical protein